MKKKNGMFLRQKGFTLVELMIVVIIISILTAVGVPLYFGYVRNAKTASAEATIAVIVNAEKLYYQRNEEFTNVTSAELEGLRENNPLRIDVREATKYWTIAVTRSDNNTFIVTATGKAGADFDYSKILVSLIYKRNGIEIWKKTENGVEF
jgi:prepilin-type N-terminal cleavage/methylation domain-containing protein